MAPLNVNNEMQKTMSLLDIYYPVIFLRLIHRVHKDLCDGIQSQTGTQCSIRQSQRNCSKCDLFEHVGENDKSDSNPESDSSDAEND